MNKASIEFRPIRDFVYPNSRTDLTILINAGTRDVKHIFLEYWTRNDLDRAHMQKKEMDRVYSDGLHDQFRTRIHLDPIAAYVRYRFEIHFSDETVTWLSSNGFESEDNPPDQSFYEFLWPNPSDCLDISDKNQSMIFYQIFPDRFRKSDDSLRKPEKLDTWGNLPTRLNYMGGDLPGIIEKLSYVKELGVNCIYINPIFEGVSNHKYDTTDYYRIDPAFGRNADLKLLVNKAHELGIRVILDGVFNHSGTQWKPFQDVLKFGNHSKYKDWFFIHRYPVTIDEQSYDCVGHYKWMPKINLANPETQDYFIDVGKYWIKEYSIDGWRLDVADEIPTQFWERFSFEIKREFPDAFLLGETWGDAHQLICGNRLDSAMNYVFRDAVVDWLAKGKISAEEFSNRINHMMMLYPFEKMSQMYNLLDSHDTPRFLFECGGDVRKLKLAVALQMLFVGCPAVYYGDEIGMTGDNDPLCRGCMVWNHDEQNQDLLSWYQKFIEVRKSYIELEQGDYRTLFADKDSIGFYRIYKDRSILVVINGGEEKEKLPIDLNKWEQVLLENADQSSGEMPENNIELQANSIGVWRMKEGVQYEF